MAGRTSPAVDHYGGVVVSVGPHGFDKLNESAARLWDAVLGPRCVVEVTNQNVVAVLRKSSVYKRQSKLSTVRFADYCCSDRMYSHRYCSGKPAIRKGTMTAYKPKHQNAQMFPLRAMLLRLSKHYRHLK